MIRRFAAMARAAAGLLVFAFVSQPASADEPSFRTHTHEYDRSGWHYVTKQTIEDHRDWYRVETIQTGRKLSDPTNDWSSYHYVRYYQVHIVGPEHVISNRDVKTGITDEVHNGTHDQNTSRTLTWTEPDGTKTTEDCSDSDKNGLHITRHEMLREDSEGHKISEYRITKPAGAETEYWQWDPQKNAMVKADRLDDTTECGDAGFPFGLLKSKPPVL